MTNRPSLSGRPLLDTAADGALFVGREPQLSTIRHAIELGLNTLVLGRRGVGVTSLLRRVCYINRREATPLVFVDAGAVDDAAGLLTMLATRLSSDAGLARPVSARAADARQGPLPELEALRRGLAVSPRCAGAIVVLDGLSSVLAHTLFGRLRDEVWSLPLVWLVTGSTSQRAEYLRPPADAFFDVVLEVPVLSSTAAVELLRRRLRDQAPDDASLTALAELTDGTPRMLLAVARHWVASGGTTLHPEVLRARESAAVRLRELGPAAGALVDQLRAVGGAASASDPAVLSALSWTRSRAAQVFRTLAHAGLVTVSEQHRPGPGRPRRIYQLVDELC